MELLSLLVHPSVRSGEIKLPTGIGAGSICSLTSLVAQSVWLCIGGYSRVLISNGIDRTENGLYMN